MLESPETLNRERDRKEDSPARAAILIQEELIQRSGTDPLLWINKHSAEFRKLFESNEEQFMHLYREQPEELYAMLEKTLEQKN